MTFQGLKIKPIELITFSSFNPSLLKYHFLNFLLNPASPSKPELTRSMVAGSGTGALTGVPSTENAV
jgi:hypothetical protein